ncbi:unnamed protein product [[Candida] boidinii]|nr:unnamed protein product [[Candida] boidinii]
MARDNLNNLNGVQVGSRPICVDLARYGKPTAPTPAGRQPTPAQAAIQPVRAVHVVLVIAWLPRNTQPAIRR